MSSARGLRLLKAIESYRNKVPYSYDSSTILNKVHLETMSHGCAKGSFIVDKSMTNAAGTLHGGYIASVVDCLSFFSLMSAPDGLTSWTTNLNVNFMKTAKIGDKVLVETKLVSSGDISTMETVLQNESGAMLAKGTANFQPASEKLQKLCKETLHFDVYKK